jgi:hypothetical protein
VVVHPTLVLGRHGAAGAGEPEDVTVDEKYHSRLRRAEQHGPLGDDIEDLFGLVAGPAERHQDVVARHRLLACDVELPGTVSGVDRALCVVSVVL